MASTGVPQRRRRRGRVHKGDVTALRHAYALVETKVIDADLLASVTRMLGQTLSRTAEWQTQLLLDRIVESPESLPGGDIVGFIKRVVPVLQRVVPVLQEVQTFVCRRHLAALAERSFVGAADEIQSGTMVVGSTSPDTPVSAAGPPLPS